MFGETSHKGEYKLDKNKIIFLDKPYDNDFIPDTITIIGDKLIMRHNSTGDPMTDFATYFLISQNNLASIQ